MDFDKQQIKNILSEFDLGEYANHLPLDEKSANRLNTSKDSYFIKKCSDLDALLLYQNVEKHLNANGIRQARLYASLSDEWMSSDGYAVFEFLEGQVPSVLNDRQLESLTCYLVKYNTALRDIQIPDSVMNLDNPWKKADSLVYLLTEAQSIIEAQRLDGVIQDVLNDALDVLAAGKEMLDQAPKQLIHGDIGSGNIVYDGDDIVALIDFTPQCGHELYSLCDFFYWTFLRFNDGQLNHFGIQKTLSLYVQESQLQESDPTLFYLLFVKAATFRLVGPILSTIENEKSYPEKALKTRARLLKTVLEDDSIKTGHFITS